MDLKAGDKMRRLRIKRGLSKRAAARTAGITRGTLDDAEQRGIITWRTARLVAPVLGVDPVELLPRS